ncbi:zinc finger protein [Ditylenchus destructor]|nr:zinc finger protein [Ditylenchus destructor]
MTRGMAKQQAKAKNEKKKDAERKTQPFDHKGAAQKSLVYKCSVCMCQMVNLASYKTHFESKHPKNPLPAEIANA